jgi:hypothetical protein
MSRRYTSVCNSQVFIFLSVVILWHVSPRRWGRPGERSDNLTVGTSFLFNYHENWDYFMLDKY